MTSSKFRTIRPAPRTRVLDQRDRDSRRIPDLLSSHMAPCRGPIASPRVSKRSLLAHRKSISAHTPTRTPSSPRCARAARSTNGRLGETARQSRHAAEQRTTGPTESRGCRVRNDHVRTGPNRERCGRQHRHACGRVPRQSVPADRNYLPRADLHRQRHPHRHRRSARRPSPDLVPRGLSWTDINLDATRSTRARS